MQENKIMNTRQYYFDWLRVLVVILLVPFHTAVSFSHIGNAYIYSKEVVDSFFFIFISDFFNLWFMRMLFFISGVAAFMSLRKRSSKEFCIERFKRLILPVFFLLVTIGPLSGYILAISEHKFQGTFTEYYLQFFINPKKYLFWGHMWFCVYLFTFSIIALPLFSFLKRRIEIVNRINSFLIKRNNILLPMFVIIVFEMAFRPFFPGLQSLIGDWANFFVHLSFFILGFITGQSSNIFETITKKMIMFFLIALSATISYFYLKRFSGFSIELYQIKVVLSMFWGIAAYTWSMFFIGFFKNYLNKTNKLLQYLSKSSFSLYLFHYFIISVINFILLKTQLNHHLIWVLTTISTYIVFIIVFEFIIKRVKPLRFICGV